MWARNSQNSVEFLICFHSLASRRWVIVTFKIIDFQVNHGQQEVNTNVLSWVADHTDHYKVESNFNQETRPECKRRLEY